MDDLWAVTAELPYRFHSIRTAQSPKAVKNSYPKPDAPILIPLRPTH